jgi:hypothetical protein
MPLDLVDDPFVPYMQVAVHAGVGAALLRSTPGDIQRSGTGPYIELELSRRMSTPVTFALYASYLTTGDEGQDADFGYSTTWSRDRIVDVAARARYHPYDGEVGPFVGGGVGYEGVRASGVDACVNPTTPPCIDANGQRSNGYYEPFNAWSHGFVVEVDAGVTMPKMDVLSIQALAILTHGTADGAPYTARLAIGVAF